MRIAIYGTTGAGKTSLIKELEKRLSIKGYKIYGENFDKCPYFTNAHVLTKEDAKDFNHKLNIWMLADRMRILKESRNEKNVIYDRTPIDSGIFVQVNQLNDMTHERDYKVFNDYFYNCFVEDLINNVNNYDLIVYLQVSPKIALKRIIQRNRKEEVVTDKRFWLSLAKTYEKRYKLMVKIAKNQKFYILNGNKKSPKELATQLIEHMKEIENKF